MTKPKKPKASEPTQRTPKGAEIPIPTREDVLRDLRKIATTKPEADASKR